MKQKYKWVQDGQRWVRRSPSPQCDDRAPSRKSESDRLEHATETITIQLLLPNGKALRWVPERWIWIKVSVSTKLNDDGSPQDSLNNESSDHQSSQSNSAVRWVLEGSKWLKSSTSPSPSHDEQVLSRGEPQNTLDQNVTRQECELQWGYDSNHLCLVLYS